MYMCVSALHIWIWGVCRFFLADLLKLCQVGWGVSVNSNLQVFPQILNEIQVWALAGPIKDFHILVLKPFQCCFGCMLGAIVLLEQQSKVSCCLKQVLLKDFPVFGAIRLFPLSLQVSQSLPLKSIPMT